jgi:hypothetical protein
MQKTFYLNPTPVLRSIAQQIGYRGEKFRVAVVGAVSLTHGLDEGSGSYWWTVDERGLLPAMFSGELTLAANLFVVEHTFFCGQDLGLTLHLHPDSVPKWVESPAPILTRDELIVLAATRDYVNSYGGRSDVRFAEANRETGIERGAWDAAGALLKSKGLLRQNGSITNEGRNVLGSRTLTILKKGDTMNLYAGYTREGLQAAFKAVCDPNDWKGPIDAKVSADELPAVVCAIQYFTATKSETWWDPEANAFCVKSIGYRAGPAGDH